MRGAPVASLPSAPFRLTLAILSLALVAGARTLPAAASPDSPALAPSAARLAARAGAPPETTGARHATHAAMTVLIGSLLLPLESA